MSKDYIIILNKAKCRKCRRIIQSKYRHNFISCKCGEISIDGGYSYLKASAKNMDNFIDLSWVYTYEAD